MTEQRHAYVPPANYEDEIYNLTKLMRARLLEHDEKRGGKSWKIARGEPRVQSGDLTSIARMLLDKSTDLTSSCIDMRFLLESGKYPPGLRATVQDTLNKRAADVANFAMILLDLTNELNKKAEQEGK